MINNHSQHDQVMNYVGAGNSQTHYQGLAHGRRMHEQSLSHANSWAVTSLLDSKGTHTSLKKERFIAMGSL